MVLQVPCFSALGQGDDAIGFVQSCWQSTHADICSLPASQTNLNQDIYTLNHMRTRSCMMKYSVGFPNACTHTASRQHLQSYRETLMLLSFKEYRTVIYKHTHTCRCGNYIGQLFDRPVASLKYVLKGSWFARSCNIGTALRIYLRCVECEDGMVWGDPDRI